MKKYTLLFAVLSLAFFLFGCQAFRFLTPSVHHDLNDTDKVTVTILENSIGQDGLTLLIENHSENELSCDMFYAIEQYKDGQWYGEGNNQEFTALAMLLPPNRQQEFHVNWDKELPKGKYRVIKSVFIGSRTAYFSAEFELA